MPKARTTCTRCSMRRQKCDRKQPCSRCVQANEADKCTRVWDGGYDARIHRAYPRGSLQHGSVGSRSPVPHSPRPANALSPAPHLDSDKATGPTNHHQALASSSTARAGNDSTLIAGIHPETNPLRPEEDVQEFDHYARFRHNEMSYLQDALPNHLLLFQLVEYHEKYLLWHHNCVHGPTFRKEVMSVLQSVGDRDIQFKELDLRWCALLFAVITASLTCATEKQALEWNLSSVEKQHYSKKWHEAAMECLVLGEFASKPHIYSIQTIQVLALSALILGLSNQQFVMLGTALRIAQSLGLQRLSYEHGEGSAELPEAVHKETGRRVWWNMVMQDWFSISSYDMFSINPQHFNIPRPTRHLDGVENLTEDQALTEYTNHILDAAEVMVDFHIATTSCTGTEAKYEELLKYDAKLRRLGSRVPCPNSSNIAWVPWARRVANVVHAHKTIILHRHFLGRSFRDNAYAYTRWASVEASKLIIRETEDSFKAADRPSIWNDQSHLTGAGVTLCLDAMHRSESETEYAEDLKMVDKALSLLAECKNSVLASRGHRLLSSMLRDGLKEPADKSTYRGRRGLAQINNDKENPSWPIENRASIDAMRANSTSNDPALTTQTGHPTPTSQRDLLSPRTSLSQQRPDIAGPATTTQAVPATDTNMQGVEPFSVGATDDLLADASWTDMLSEFFPDQLGFGNALDFDELFNNPFPT